MSGGPGDVVPVLSLPPDVGSYSLGGGFDLDFHRGDCLHRDSSIHSTISVQAGLGMMF